MKLHVKNCYHIHDVEKDLLIENPTPSKKQRPASSFFEKIVEPIEDQINRDVSKNGASFRCVLAFTYHR